MNKRDESRHCIAAFIRLADRYLKQKKGQEETTVEHIVTILREASVFITDIEDVVWFTDRLLELEKTLLDTQEGKALELWIEVRNFHEEFSIPRHANLAN